MDDLQTALATSKLKGFDITNLWRKETYVDMDAGEITVLIPVTVNGKDDLTRARRFFSASIALLQGRQIPVPFEMEGVTSLDDACEKWVEQATAAGRKFIEQAEASMRRQSLMQGAPLPMGRKLDS